ncbi:hypothetical protein NM208_g12324 [Fusarium decemcellulare]|uniref:Uncharacterized protein n=1 Tax=Fusarium decemcellulare TaxID=57161 RepID=A0ACC1RPR2_9HYPO|nr:hypothetical protein NM208_g12324 [Fusarium decemcellulare]
MEPIRGDIGASQESRREVKMPLDESSKAVATWRNAPAEMNDICVAGDTWSKSRYLRDDLEQDDIVKIFSHAMFTNMNPAEMICVAADRHSRQYILPHIVKAVGKFTEAVEADEFVVAAKMIRLQSSEIAAQFHDSISGGAWKGDTKGGLMIPMENPPSPVQQASQIPIQTWLNTPSSVDFREQTDAAKDPFEDWILRDSYADYMLEDAPTVHRPSSDPVGILEAFTRRPEFKHLMTTVEHQIQRYNCTKMPFISYKTSLALQSSHRHRKNGDKFAAAFNVDWDLTSFLVNNYEAGIHQKLDKIVAITGAIDTAQLCSVGQYFKFRWPEQSSQLLEALEQQICHSNSRENLPNKSLKGRRWLPTSRLAFGSPSSNKITVDPTLRTIWVSGTETFITSVAQQIAWLVAAFQEKKDKPSYAYIGFANTSKSNNSQVPMFDIDARLETLPQTDSTGSCWNTVIGPAVIITGFPLPDRDQDEQGLEVSVQVMAQLLGLPRAVTFEGGFVFKGRYTALVPVKKLGPCVQWHIIDTYPDKLKWEDIDVCCPVRITGEANMVSFPDGRSFFGWCPKVLEWLATAEYNYGLTRYSGACAPSQWAQIDKIQLGFSQWATLTAEITLGRRDGYRCQRPDDYEMLLKEAMNTHIILYDTEDRRATQTNAEDLILHVLLHKRSQRNQDANCRGQDLEFANADRRALPTREVMVRNAEKIFGHRRPVSSSKAIASLFEQEVESLYATIDGLWAQEYKSTRSYSLKMKLDPRPSVHGWEYMDLVEDNGWMSPKSVTMDSKCGRWNEYARDIQALVLFGAGFGDILTPVLPGTICPVLTSIPKGYSFLGIRVDTLERLFTLQGSLGNQAKLSTSGLALSGSTDLFKGCKQGAGEKCGPQCLVRFVMPGRLRGKQHLLPLETDGAIIIGQLGDEVLHRLCRQEMKEMKEAKEVKEVGMTWNWLKSKLSHLDPASDVAPLTVTPAPITCRQEGEGDAVLTGGSSPTK